MFMFVIIMFDPTKLRFTALIALAREMALPVVMAVVPEDWVLSPVSAELVVFVFVSASCVTVIFVFAGTKLGLLAIAASSAL